MQTHALGNHTLNSHDKLHDTILSCVELYDIGSMFRTQLRRCSKILGCHSLLFRVHLTCAMIRNGGLSIIHL